MICCWGELLCFYEEGWILSKPWDRPSSEVVTLPLLSGWDRSWLIFGRKRSVCDGKDRLRRYSCCFLFSCDSAAESSKCLWVMSWWPGSTYWSRSFNCRPPAVHAWRTTMSSWRRTTPSWRAQTLWTWSMSSLRANSWKFWTQRSWWARWAEIRFWKTSRCEEINNFYILCSRAKIQLCGFLSGNPELPEFPSTPSSKSRPCSSQVASLH